MLHWILNLFRRYLQTTFCHATSSIFFGCVDVVEHATYTILGRDRHPPYYRGWQAECFPPRQYPLPETGPAPKPRFSIWDTRGFYTTTVFFRYLTADQAKQFLPPGLELEPSLIDAQGMYPMVYMFGYQQDLRRVWNPLRGINYLEFAIGVLGLKCPSAPGYNGPFMYMPRLFLNRFYPTWLGWLCGYPKILKRVSTGPASYTVKSLFRGEPMIDAQFEPHGTIGPWQAFEHFAPWRRQMAAPTANSYVDDGFLFLYFDWPWRYALMQAVSGTVKVTTDDIPGLPRGTYRFDGIDSSPVGGFRLAIPWELVAPFATGELPHPFEDLAPAEPAAAAAAQASTGSHRG